jgi:hypothetical protein
VVAITNHSLLFSEKGMRSSDDWLVSTCTNMVASVTVWERYSHCTISVSISSCYSHILCCTSCSESNKPPYSLLSSMDSPLESPNDPLSMHFKDIATLARDIWVPFSLVLITQRVTVLKVFLSLQYSNII